MKVAISTARQAHYRLPANAFVRLGHTVTMYTSTPPGRLKNFDPSIRQRFVPAPVTLVNGLTRLPMPVLLNDIDCAIYDRLASLAVKDCDLFLGASTSCLNTGKAVQRQGAKFVLDRACPDIRVQQAMMVEEAKKVGGIFRTNAPWFIERQVAEYEQADFILSPSNYSARSFPSHLSEKVCLAPLFGRAQVAPRKPKPAGAPFVVGVVVTAASVAAARAAQRAAKNPLQRRLLALSAARQTAGRSAQRLADLLRPQHQRLLRRVRRLHPAQHRRRFRHGAV